MKSNMNIEVDFLFIGLGAANSLLLLNLFEKGLLKDKKIAVIEPSSKNVNDRTFCFWTSEEEVSELNLQQLISSSWSHINVNGLKQHITPLNYFHIKGIDLYNKAKEILKKETTQFYTTSLSNEPNILNNNSYQVDVGNDKIIAQKVFDSRPPIFSPPKNNQSHLYQSFYGWEIQTTNAEFDTSTATMMDFDIAQNNACQFMYILPFTDRTALFEITRFGKEIISKHDAEIIFKEYIQKLGINYTILDKEIGVVPMSSATIANNHYGANWLYTGAKANMIKPSTGYAFHAMAKDAKSLAEAIQKGELYKRNNRISRFKFYDRLLLKILELSPSRGKEIFQCLFTNIPISKVLTFLNEKTSIPNEIHIFSKLPIALFLKTAVKDVSYKISALTPTLAALLFTLASLFLHINQWQEVLWIFLGLGFLTIGLSHGAVDHLTDQKINGQRQFIKFIAAYLAKGALLGAIWFILPDLALITFIAYSAWHFGQADTNEWNLKQGPNSFLWGLSVLALILIFHFEETLSVLEHIKGLKLNTYLQTLTQPIILYSKLIVSMLSILMIVYNKSKRMALTFSYLLISSMLPLLVSFGIYFVIQHSFHGWSHLKTALKTNTYQLWKKSLPFSMGGAFIIVAFMLLNRADYISIFFILLSCISIPHVLSMDLFYKKNRVQL
jgi:lycopene beta-cyclase